MPSQRLSVLPIEEHIYYVRHEKVMLDADLAVLYGVQTKVLIQAVKRNIDRFPQDFMFQLTQNEFDALRSQSVTSSRGRSKVLTLEPLFVCGNG